MQADDRFMLQSPVYVISLNRVSGQALRMDELVKLLHEWENLTGALAGGLFSLGVALIVANSARRVEERTAAMIVISNLVQFLMRVRTLKRLAAEQNISDKDYGMWVSEKLTYSRPKLSGTFEASVARLLPTHVSAAAHLETFYMLAREIDERIDRVTEDFNDFHANGKAKRPLAVMESDAKLIGSGLYDAELHADLAVYMLTRLVLGKYPTFYRLRRRFCPSETDMRSIRALLPPGP